MQQSECSLCKGTRFNTELNQVFLGGMTISGWFDTEIVKLIDVCVNLEKDLKQDTVEYLTLREVYQRLIAMVNVGVGYLKLGRSTNSLSGGELHQIKLAKNI